MSLLLLNYDANKWGYVFVNYGSHIDAYQNFFLLKNNTEFIFFYEKKEKCGHTQLQLLKWPG